MRTAEAIDRLLALPGRVTTWFLGDAGIRIGYRPRTIIRLNPAISTRNERCMHPLEREVVSNILAYYKSENGRFEQNGSHEEDWRIRSEMQIWRDARSTIASVRGDALRSLRETRIFRGID